jgi:hypothetical protein
MRTRRTGQRNWRLRFRARDVGDGRNQPEGDEGMGELLQENAETLVTLVSEIEKTAEALPEDERRAYEDAQESIVEARRSAEIHEGTLQLN